MGKKEKLSLRITNGAFKQTGLFLSYPLDGSSAIGNLKILKSRDWLVTQRKFKKNLSARFLLQTRTP